MQTTETAITPAETAETVQQTYQTLLAARLAVARTVTAYLSGRVDRWELAAVSAAETRAHEAWTAAVMATGF